MNTRVRNGVLFAFQCNVTPAFGRPRHRHSTLHNPLEDLPQQTPTHCSHQPTAERQTLVQDHVTLERGRPVKRRRVVPEERRGRGEGEEGNATKSSATCVYHATASQEDQGNDYARSVQTERKPTHDAHPRRQGAPSCTDSAPTHHTPTDRTTTPHPHTHACTHAWRKARGWCRQTESCAESAPGLPGARP